MEPLGLALNLAHRFPIELTFLHCLPSSALSSKLLFPKAHTAGEQNLVLPGERQVAEEKISSLLADLPLGDLRHSRLIVKGVVLHEILKAADSIHPDLIIQGRRLSFRRQEWFSGGISWKLIQKAPCPVMTVKHAPPASRLFLRPGEQPLCVPGNDPADDQRKTSPERKLILLTAFGKSSARALPHAAWFAKKTGAELIILHLFVQDRSDRYSVDLTGELQLLVEKAESLQNGLKVSSVLAAGDPEEAILPTIGGDDVDMIVMGAGNDSGPGQLPGNRFTERILRWAHCPVLTVNRDGNSPGIDGRYRTIFQRLAPEDLVRISDEQPDTIGEDLFSGKESSRTSELFLKYYSQAGLTRIFEEYGIFSLIRQKGFTNPGVSLKLDDPFRQRLRIFFDNREDDNHILIEMILREGILESPRPKEAPGRGHYFPVLMVEWLCMQNPTAAFTPERPPLPGQQHPGLGISREILQLISLIGLRIGKDGIAIHPQYFHAAVLYHGLFQCYNPVQEGQLSALMRDTEEFNLADVSWAIDLDCLRDGRNMQKSVSWNVDWQVHPLTAHLKNHFHAEQYRDLYWKSLSGHRYGIDWQHFERRFHDRIGENRGDPQPAGST